MERHRLHRNQQLIIQIIKPMTFHFFSKTCYCIRAGAALLLTCVSLQAGADDPEKPQPGWSARYFDGREFQKAVLTRVDPAIDYDWKDAPVPRLFPDNFSVKWAGVFTPPIKDIYTFTLAADDGARLWINGQLVLSEWNPAVGGSMGWRSVEVPLEAGQPVKVLLDYFQGWGGASAILYWSSPNQNLALLGSPEITSPATNQAPYLAVIADQNSLTGTRVDLPLVASDAEGDPISFKVSGLPPGVSLRQHSGAPLSYFVSGRPVTPGVYSVKVIAETPDKQVVARDFIWTVEGKPLPGLEMATELVQCSLTVTPTEKGFRVSYSVPAVLGELYTTQLESSPGLLEWKPEAAIPSKTINDDILYSLDWHLKFEGPQSGWFWRVVLKVR